MIRPRSAFPSEGIARPAIAGFEKVATGVEFLATLRLCPSASRVYAWFKAQRTRENDRSAGWRGGCTSRMK